MNQSIKRIHKRANNRAPPISNKAPATNEVRDEAATRNRRPSRLPIAAQQRKLLTTLTRSKLGLYLS